MSCWQHDKNESIRWARELLRRDFVVLDLETTGLGPDDEAVSIGLIDKHGVVLLDTLLCHQKQSHPKALDTHNITWQMTRSAPTFANIWPTLVKSSNDKILVAYNADYDIRIIEQMMRRYQLGGTNPEFYGDTTCAMYPYSKFHGDWSQYHGSYTWKKLTVAAQRFGIDTKGAHGAAADAFITLQVIKAMAKTKMNSEEKNE